jgi:hypothetical protein
VDPKIIILLSVLSAVGLGLGVGLAFVLIPAGRRSRRDLKAWENSPDARLRERAAEDTRQRKLLPFPTGRRRNSSVCGVITNLLRNRDGSYTKGYRLKLAPSIYDEDGRIEGKIDDIGSFLRSAYPPGTTFQFRLNVTPDNGEVIRNHVAARGEGHHTHALAGLLHTSSVGFYQEAVDRGVFRNMMLSLWVRVPVKHAHDRTGISALLPALRREIHRRGLFGFLKSLPAAYRRASDKAAVIRARADEEETMREAARVFRSVEAQCPTELGLEAMTREEIWDALFLSHRQNAVTSPELPDTPGSDIRDYTCAESVEGTGWFLMHGSYPVAVVSAFVPPQPVITADSMRKITANPALNFRHVTVTEFVTLDQKKSKKKLETAIRQAELTGNTFVGKRELKEDAKSRIRSLKLLLQHVEDGNELLVEARFYVVVYGERARTREELEASVAGLDADCETVIASIKKISGADAEREEPAALRAMYLRSMVGEFDAGVTGREQPEVADSLAALVPTESAWEGSRRKQILFVTPSGHMTGVDLYDRSKIKSPTVLITAASGEGKSVTGARIINTCLTQIPHLKVSAIDYKRSLGPLAETLHARDIEFDEKNLRALNDWYYPGLFEGARPDKVQLSFVEGSIRLLGSVEKTDVIGRSVVKTVVEEVYKIAVGRNGAGLPDFEPTLTSFLNVLRKYQWENDSARRRAEDLYVALNVYRRDPLLDAPTHPDFKADSVFDRFELESLSALDESVRGAMAYRIAAHVMRSIGDRLPDGTYRPVLLVFDEMKEIIKKYPAILEVIETATRMGRKDGVVTLLMSQAYEDFIGTEAEPNPIGIALAKNSGVKLIGKQIGGFHRLAEDCELAPNAVAAVRALKNVTGKHSQWLLVVGSGGDKVVELVQVNLSPSELWTFTTDTNEKNARTIIANHMPAWPTAVVVAALAEKYPSGLTADNLTGVDVGYVLDERMAA